MAAHMRSSQDVKDYLAEGQKQGVPVFIKFTAKWCGPCKVIAPHFDALAKSQAHRAYFISVDIDQIPDTAAAYKVRSIPAFAVVKDLQTKKVWTGANPSMLQKEVAQHLPSE